MSIINLKFCSYAIKKYLYIYRIYHGTHIQTTEKGLNFLKMHNEIGELLQITTIKNY